MLARQGHSIRQTAKTLGVSRNTARGYLREPSVPRYSRVPRAAKLDAVRGCTHERVRQAHQLWLGMSLPFESMTPGENWRIDLRSRQTS